MISDERFGKKEHILKSGDFRAVYKKGRSLRRDGAVVCCLPNDLPQSRLGFSISSSNIRRAHDRNRLRRIFREAYRKNKPIVKTGFDIVLILKRLPGKQAGRAWAEERLLGFFGALGLLKDKVE